MNSIEVKNEVLKQLRHIFASFECEAELCVNCSYNQLCSNMAKCVVDLKKELSEQAEQ